jgi:hypothetical protein
MPCCDASGLWEQAAIKEGKASTKAVCFSLVAHITKQKNAIAMPLSI